MARLAFAFVHRHSFLRLILSRSETKIIYACFSLLVRLARPQWKPQATCLSLDRLTAMPFQRVSIPADSLNHSLSIFLIENRIERTAPFGTCFCAFIFFFRLKCCEEIVCPLVIAPRKMWKHPPEHEQHDPKIAPPNKKLTRNTSHRKHSSRFPLLSVRSNIVMLISHKNN